MAIRLVCAIGLLLGYPMLGPGQDLGNLGLRDKPTVTGNVRLGSHFYSYTGDGTPRNAPLTLSLTGGLNLRYGQLVVPVSFSVSRQQGSVSNPFNLYGASPYYKWAKLHLGHRTLPLSPYVFSGRAFLGAGLELTPGKFRLVAFSGKMRNLLALQEVPNPDGPVVLPSYNRRVVGAKIGVVGRRAGLELVGVKIKDDAATAAPTEAALPPLENLVLGTKAHVTLRKVLTLEVNGAASLLSTDQLAGFNAELPQSVRDYEGIFAPNISTRFSFAGDASLNYRHKQWNAGLKYRRIQPFFQSYGINFLQNDVENYTASLAMPLLKRKLRVQATGGLQRDNLGGNKAFTSERLVGSVSANYLKGAELSLMARYANYQHENQSGLVEVNDTLKFVTITNNAFVGARIQLADKPSGQLVWSVNGFRNGMVSESQRSQLSNAGFTGLGLTSSLTYHLKTSAWSIGPTFNLNRYDYHDRSQGRTGGGLTVGKPWWNKTLHTSLTALYNTNTLNAERDGHQLNLALNATARLKGGHSLSARLNYLDNQATAAATFRELRGFISYGYAINPPRRS